MRNLGHIYWKSLKIHEILIIFNVFWTQKLKFYQYLTFFQNKFLKFGIYLPIFVKKYGNFWKFNAQFWGRFIIFSPRNGADLFSICRITTPVELIVDKLGSRSKVTFQSHGQCQSQSLTQSLTWTLELVTIIAIHMCITTCASCITTSDIHP